MHCLFVQRLLYLHLTVMGSTLSTETAAVGYSSVTFNWENSVTSHSVVILSTEESISIDDAVLSGSLTS